MVKKIIKVALLLLALFPERYICGDQHASLSAVAQALLPESSKKFEVVCEWPEREREKPMRLIKLTRQGGSDKVVVDSLSAGKPNWFEATVYQGLEECAEDKRGNKAKICVSDDGVIKVETGQPLGDGADGRTIGKAFGIPGDGSKCELVPKPSDKVAGNGLGVSTKTITEMQTPGSPATTTRTTTETQHHPGPPAQTTTNTTTETVTKTESGMGAVVSAGGPSSAAFNIRQALLAQSKVVAICAWKKQGLGHPFFNIELLKEADTDVVSIWSVAKRESLGKAKIAKTANDCSDAKKPVDGQEPQGVICVYDEILEYETGKAVADGTGTFGHKFDFRDAECKLKPNAEETSKAVPAVSTNVPTPEISTGIPAGVTSTEVPAVSPTGPAQEIDTEGPLTVGKALLKHESKVVANCTWETEGPLSNIKLTKEAGNDEVVIQSTIVDEFECTVPIAREADACQRKTKQTIENGVLCIYDQVQTGSLALNFESPKRLQGQPGTFGHRYRDEDCTLII